MGRLFGSCQVLWQGYKRWEWVGRARVGRCWGKSLQFVADLSSTG